MNMNNDFELTSENQNPERKHSTGDNARIRIKEITRSGNLRIPGDDIWPYWKLIKSDNYFERLFLDIEQHDKITNETVTNHYTEISGYLEKWRERESAGINFSDSHGGYSLKEIRENLDEAFELLRHKSSRESYTDQHFAKVRSDRAKLLIPVIKTALADKVLTTEEKQLVFEEGNKIGMSVDEILELLTKIINETGDIRDESSNSNGGEVLSFYDAVSIIGADTSKTFDQAKKRYLKLRDEQIADLSSSSTEERNAARVKLQQLDEAFSVLTKNSHKFRQKNEGASDVTRTSSAQTDLSTPRVSSSREASSVNYDTRKTGRNYTPLFLILGFFVVGLIFIISTTNKSKDFSSGTPANDNSTVSSETQTYQGANRNSGGNNNNKPETDKSDNSGSVSQPETNTDTPPIDGNSKTETPTPEPAVKKESVTVKPTTDDVLAFLSYYTRTLLYGTYTDHAALFDSQCDWEGTTYSSASMYSIASNFYGGYSTLEHSFNLLDASFDSGGNATVTVTEYQRTRNKYSGAYASASVKKRMLLNYYSGTFRISYVRTIATY